MGTKQQWLRWVLCAFVVSGTLAAQQTGDADRDYTINGVGAGGTSPVVSSMGIPNTFGNGYATSSPNAPVIWAYATQSTPNWFPPLVASSVDIGPAGLTYLLDGSVPSPIAPYLQTDVLGNFSLTLPAPSNAAGTSGAFAMAHITAASPDGFYVSQTHVISFVLDPNLGVGNAACTPGATPVTLSDDSFSQQALGFTFTFYGVGYTDCYVGSNGHITFGTGNSGWASGVLANAAAPTIATLSEDLNPSQGGVVSFYTDNIGTFEVCFAGVPSYFNTGANSFRTSCTAGIAITMDYGVLSDTDGTVGLTPGSSVSPTPLLLNLSLAPALVLPTEAPYEDFFGDNDLAGFQILWLLDATGAPTAQL